MKKSWISGFNKFLILAVLSVLAVSCGGSGGNGTDEPKKEKTKVKIKDAVSLKEELVIAIAQEFDSLNPMITQMSAAEYILAMTNRSLNNLSPELNIENHIAVSTPTLENGKAVIYEENGKRMIKCSWEIRPEAKWGDGTDVTGHDIKFTWTVGLNENVTIAERKSYKDIKKIEVDADNPKKFTVYQIARYDYFKRFGSPILPKHLEEPVFNQYKDEPQGYEKNSNYVTNPDTPGLYCGPYLIKEVKLGSHVILEPNPHFYGKKPSFKRITIKKISETSTLLLNLKNNNIDMIAPVGLNFDDVLVFKRKCEEENLPYTVHIKEGLVYEHIDLNLRNPILQDLRVRKALVYALNREKLSEDFFEGKQAPAIHNIAPSDPAYIDDPEKFVFYYSTRKAKKLLDEAGWKMQDDGYRYKDGKRLEFVLMTTAGNKIRSQVQVWLQSEWKKVGIHISIKNQNANNFFGKTVKRAEYPHMAMFAWLSLPDSTVRSTLHSNSIPTEKNSFSGSNSGGWKNAKVDSWIDEFELELDLGKRIKIMQKILVEYSNDVPVIPLFYRTNSTVTPAKIKGLRISGHNISEAMHVEDWYIEK